MAGISRYEKAALGLTAAFLLFTGGWFYARQSAAQPYTVTVSQSAPEVSLAGGARPLPVGGRARSGLRHWGKAAGRAAGLCRGGAGGLNARR